MIVVDTSALIDSLTGSRGAAARMRALIEEGERLTVPALALYEWWRGPRSPEELAAQEALFPRESAPSFGTEEAAIAARLYAALPRARGREIDLAIAAHAIARGARLWTIDPSDFADIPGLALVPA